MKELSIEEKAKRYNDALERAKEQLNGAKVFDYDNEQIAHDIRTTVYNIFPELKEPEDEKIRKELISYFKQFANEELRGVNISDWIAWLEKQGEHANFRNKIQIGDKVTKNDNGNEESQRMISAKAKEAGYTSKDFTFKSIPRILEMVKPSERAKSYCEELVKSLENEGYPTDAKIVRNFIKRMNCEKVSMATMDEEPVSEDLEEAARKYADEEEYGDDVYYSIKATFKEGANWQKEQFEKNRLVACDAQTPEEAEREMNFATNIIEKEHRTPTYDDAIKYGMRLQKEEMMKGAVDAEVTYGKSLAIPSLGYFLDKNEINVGDKVKLILIKSE